MTPLLKDRDGAIVTLVLNAPETRNALSAMMTKAIVETCQEINADLTVGCVILTAAGDVFSAGGNIKDMYARAHQFSGNAAEFRRSYLHGVQTIAKAIYDLEVPIIAAVNGPAIGVGMDFAGMCTIRIASERATFAESFIKLGLTSAAGGSWFLPRIVGGSMAAELMLTGDTIDAQRALDIGFISRIASHEALTDEALSIARRIVRHPLHSIRLNTRLLRESGRQDLYAALELAAAMQAIANQTDDQYEAVAAAVEKRPPQYRGR